MKLLVEPIEPSCENLYQGLNMNLPIGNDTKRVSLDLIYMEEIDRWVMSLFDLQTNEVYFRSVPLVASYNVINDLWKPFAYKGIGVFYCIPKTDSPSTENPSKDNLSEFYMIWGDTLE